MKYRLVLIDEDGVKFEVLNDFEAYLDRHKEGSDSWLDLALGRRLLVIYRGIDKLSSEMEDDDA